MTQYIDDILTMIITYGRTKMTFTQNFTAVGGSLVWYELVGEHQHDDTRTYTLN